MVYGDVRGGEIVRDVSEKVSEPILKDISDSVTNSILIQIIVVGLSALALAAIRAISRHLRR